MTKWTYSPQKGTPGHCFQAQVWNEKDESIAVIEATKNAKDATEIAKLMSEAPQLKEQNEKMHKALKGVIADLIVIGEVHKNTREKIESLLKEMK